MSFSTTIFIFAFLPAALLGYYICPSRIRNMFLLFASLAFYAVGGSEYIAILLFSIVFNYLVGLLLKTADHKSLGRKAVLFIGILGNLFPLFYYKYFDFAVLNLNNLLNITIPPRNLVLPLGISFFTFKALTYLMDVYREKEKANRSIVDLAVYISIFPQVTAGPIMPYADLQPQIKERTSTAEAFADGIRRFSYGLAKKVIIADTLGLTADQIFTAAHSQEIDLPTAWLGIFCYTLQIFFDFSGYTDMAVGLGKMFGFTFMENFNYPYISKSITEFWRRWHISLSSWFRDYLYMPLGGSRRGNVYSNLFVVFAATGIWHGASWTYVIWGLWHGLFIIMERIARNKSWQISLPPVLKMVLTLFIVAMGWVLFRCASISDAVIYYQLLFGVIKNPWPEFTFVYYFNGQVLFTLILASLLSAPLLAKIAESLEGKTIFTAGRVVFSSVLLVIGIIFVVSSTYCPFIYYQY